MTSSEAKLPTTEVSPPSSALQAMLRRWEGGNPLVLRNGIFLILNTGAGSVFGFLFWAVAARTATPREVGLGAAYISALTLLTLVTDLGLSSVLIRYAPGMGSERTIFVNSALTFVVVATVAASALFTVGTPLWSPDMSALIHSPATFGVFVLSTTLFAAALFTDKVFVAFEVAHFMFLRNLISNTLRVALIILTARTLGAVGLVLAVAGGSLAGVLLAGTVLMPRVIPGYRVQIRYAWKLFIDRVAYSLGNHFATLLWGLPGLLYPLIVVSLLGPGPNARFYMSWMIANLLFIVPVSIFTAAFARVSTAGRLDERWFWRTVRWTLIALIGPAAALATAGPIVLALFGHHYSGDGPWLLLWLVLSVFPYTVSTAVITLHRIEHSIARMALASAAITGLSLGLSLWLGATHGLPGIGAGWLIGQSAGVVLALLTRPPMARML